MIIPVYNSEEYLKRCLDSILRQTYRRLEVIVIDDGSTDKSPLICGEYAAADARVTVIRKESRGVSSARNAGLEAASGDLIGFADSDDFLEPEMFEYLVGLMESGADITQCGVFYDEGRHSEAKYAPPENITITGGLDGFTRSELKYLANSNYCKLFRSRLLKAIRFDETLCIGEDLLFNSDALKKADKVVLGSEALYHYTIRAGSLCRSGYPREKLLNYRAALEIIISENVGNAAAEYYSEEKLRNITDIFSKIITGKISGCEDIIETLRAEIKDNMPAIKRGEFSYKDRLKLMASAYNWQLYKALLPVYKRFFGG